MILVRGWNDSTATPCPRPRGGTSANAIRVASTVRSEGLGRTEGAGHGIDHILVAGAAAGPLTVWERSRRVQNGLVLSDHAPVERLVG